MLLLRPALVLAAASSLVVLSLGGSQAQAQVERSAPTACAKSGALGSIGCALAKTLLPAAAGADVAVLELKSDRELPAPDALRERLRDVVRAALTTGAANGARGERSKLRVELRVEKSGGLLRVSAELRRATGLWQRIRKAKPESEAHAFAEAVIDAELRALIPPPPLVVSEVIKIKTPERGIVALACGALGSEGAQELALVSRSGIRVGRIVRGAFAERGKVSWASLSAVAPAPLREPIATAEVTSRGVLRVGITDRKDGVALDQALNVVERFAGRLPAPGGGCLSRSGLGLGGELFDCAGAGALPGQGVSGVLDALTGFGSGRLGRELGSGKLRGAGGELRAVPHAGAQLALGDADGDGAPELAYAADTLEPGKDRLTVVTLEGDKPKRRFELAAPSISAIAICAGREGPGMAPLALVSADELWLVR